MPLIAFAVLTIGVACKSSPVAISAAATCQLTEVKGSSGSKDILSGVVPAGHGMVVIGTRYAGSSGEPMYASGTTAAWRARAIKVSTPLSTEMGEVGGAASNDRWAVGTIAQAAPLILSWKGASWTEQHVADPGPLEDGLSGVGAVSRSFVWAVGRHGTDAGFRTLVERWNGAGWRTTPSPNLGNSDALNDVAVRGAKDAWAVGWAVEGRIYTTLALHWNGSAWTTVPTPHVGPGDAVLSGVAVTPSGVWAVGWISRGDAFSPLIERWTGRAWVVVRTPLALSGAAFTDIAAHGSTLAIVGRRFVGGHPQPLVVLRTGGAWQLPTVTHAAGQGSLSSVAFGSSGAVWAVGNQVDGNGQASSLVVSGC